MSVRHISIAIIGLAWSTLVVAEAPAAAKKGKPDPRKPPNTPMGKCMAEVGAYWDAHGYRWYFVGGAGNPQEQAYYDCLDRIANPRMKR